MIPMPNSANASSNNDVVMQYVVYQVPSSEVVIAESWLERRHISRSTEQSRQQQQQQHLSTSRIFADIESTQVVFFFCGFVRRLMSHALCCSTIASVRCCARWHHSISSRSQSSLGAIGRVVSFVRVLLLNGWRIAQHADICHDKNKRRFSIDCWRSTIRPRTCLFFTNVS